MGFQFQKAGCLFFCRGALSQSSIISKDEIEKVRKDFEEAIACLNSFEAQNKNLSKLFKSMRMHIGILEKELIKELGKPNITRDRYNSICDIAEKTKEMAKALSSEEKEMSVQDIVEKISDFIRVTHNKPFNYKTRLAINAIRGAAIGAALEFAFLLIFTGIYVAAGGITHGVGFAACFPVYAWLLSVSCAGILGAFAGAEYESRKRSTKVEICADEIKKERDPDSERSHCLMKLK